MTRDTMNLSTFYREMIAFTKENKTSPTTAMMSLEDALDLDSGGVLKYCDGGSNGYIQTPFGAVWIVLNSVSDELKFI